MHLLTILCCGISSSDGGYTCKSSGALFVGVVDAGLGMVAKWVDVEVVVVRGLMDKYRSTTCYETTLVGVDVRWEGPLGRVYVV